MLLVAVAYNKQKKKCRHLTSKELSAGGGDTRMKLCTLGAILISLERLHAGLSTRDFPLPLWLVSLSV